MSPYFERQNEDASCSRKICAASADRCTKREPCHSQELFDRSKADEKFLKNVITVDETCVYFHDVEKKFSHRSGWENRCHDQKKHFRVALM